MRMGKSHENDTVQLPSCDTIYHHLQAFLDPGLSSSPLAPKPSFTKMGRLPMRTPVQVNRALNFKVSGNIKCTSQVLIVAIQLAMVSSAPSDVNGLGLGASFEECNSTLQQIYKFLQILCLCPSASNLYWLAFQGSLIDFRLWLQIKR